MYKLYFEKINKSYATIKGCIKYDDLAGVKQLPLRFTVFQTIDAFLVSLAK